ncbi:MAG: putative zinc-binding metallopeptidase [Bdellovibrionota bacterium]|nr:putative zinc-binding metallopeptidase [Bdellovibrionota bacterium]
MLLDSIKLKQYYKISVRKSDIGIWIEDFEKELKAKKLPKKVRYLFGDEWYYIEGSNIIVIPFYLHSLSFARALKRKSCFVEGLTKETFLKLIRHEYGHYFECLFQTRKKALRKSLFGKNIKYPKSYLPKDNDHEFVKHLPNHYAQSHPDEDFAESFAVALRNDNWKRKYPKSSLAYAKLNYVDGLINDNKKINKRKILIGDVCLPKQNQSLQRWMNENQKKSISPFVKQKISQLENFVASQDYDKQEKKRLVKALGLAISEKKHNENSIEHFIQPAILEQEIKKIRKKKAHYISM